jgi:hypothetical protein
MALQKVRTNPEVLHAVIVDGINAYVRDVLVAQGLLDEGRLDQWTGPDLEEMKHAIATRIAASWEAFEVDEEA